MLSPRNYGFELVRATEAAAIEAGRFMGLDQRTKADEAATLAMRNVLNDLHFQGRIVVGEELRLNNQSLFSSGQKIGTGEGEETEIVADAIDGHRLLAHGDAGVLSAVAIASRGSMWSPFPAAYMDKLVVDHEVADAIVPEMMDAPVAWTLSLIANIKQKEVRDLVVFVLNRRRHRDLVNEIRAVGARVMLRLDGDISGALLAAFGKIDLMLGIGGASEGIMAACAVKSLGGAMLGRLAPQSNKERAAVKEAGLDTQRILTVDEMVKGDGIFFAATGITDGPLLDGVRYRGKWCETHSLLLCHHTRARRFIRAEQYLE